LLIVYVDRGRPNLDAVALPVVAACGIADGRGIAAALMLGASAVQIGTGFLRTPEAKIAPAWADGLGKALPENAVMSRPFSGRMGRNIVTDYVKAAMAQSHFGQ
jgi:nitronate monooxygenase